MSNTRLTVRTATWRDHCSKPRISTFLILYHSLQNEFITTTLHFNFETEKLRLISLTKRKGAEVKERAM